MSLRRKRAAKLRDFSFHQLSACRKPATTSRNGKNRTLKGIADSAGVGLKYP